MILLCILCIYGTTGARARCSSVRGRATGVRSACAFAGARVMRVRAVDADHENKIFSLGARRRRRRTEWDEAAGWSGTMNACVYIVSGRDGRRAPAVCVRYAPGGGGRPARGPSATEIAKTYRGPAPRRLCAICVLMRKREDTACGQQSRARRRRRRR